MRKSLSLLVLTTLLGALVVEQGASAPLKVDADPNKDYPVFAAAGDWMVLVAYYTGPEAESLAHQMVYKIRAQHNLPAYLFVYIDPERQRQKEELDKAHELALKMMKESGSQPVEMRRRTIRVEKQYGVLIGGWADIDTANVALKAIREIKNPPELVSTTGRTTMDTVIQAVLDEKGRPVRDANGAPKYVRLRVNPFTTAIVTRNPAAPSQRSARQADPALKKFNSEEEYSLLKCPRAYTLLVKEYTGAAAIQDANSGKDEGFLSALGLGGNKPGEALDAAALQAHETARVLRQLNFEAYVLHSRTSSAVTVGGFEGPNDPSLQRVSQQLAQVRQQMISRMGSDPMQLYPTPLPVEIPRP